MTEARVSLGDDVSVAGGSESMKAGDVVDGLANGAGEDLTMSAGDSNVGRGGLTSLSAGGSSRARSGSSVGGSASLSAGSRSSSGGGAMTVSSGSSSDTSTGVVTVESPDGDGIVGDVGEPKHWCRKLVGERRYDGVVWIKQ
jgi:hypothetical protein